MQPFSEHILENTCQRALCFPACPPASPLFITMQARWELRIRTKVVSRTLAQTLHLTASPTSLVTQPPSPQHSLSFTPVITPICSHLHPQSIRLPFRAIFVGDLLKKNDARPHPDQFCQPLWEGGTLVHTHQSFLTLLPRLQTKREVGTSAPQGSVSRSSLWEMQSCRPCCEF